VGFTCDLFVPRENLTPKHHNNARNAKKKKKSIGSTRQIIQKQKETTTVPLQNIINFKKPDWRCKNVTLNPI
jgi:hypothetical protein